MFYRAFMALASAGLCLASGALVDLGALPQTPAQAPRNRAPIADAGGPYAEISGRGVLLSAASSTDPDGDDLAFAWDFGDGHSATGSSATHVYDALGSYAVTLLASDGRGGVSTASTRVVVTNLADGNRPPVAVDNGPFVGPVNQDFVFDASGSQDPDDDALEHAWTFGDGTSGSGATVSHAYARPGTYTVKVLVTDPRGGASMRLTTAFVLPLGARSSNSPPIAEAHGPDEAWGGVPVTFNGDDSSDPDDDPLTFIWTFDDGDTATGKDVTHTFVATGSHTVKLTVSDGRGGFDSTSREIDIERTENNLYPIVELGGPYTGRVGIPVALNAGASRDPDGDDITFAWDFGDGTKGSGATPRHTYKKPGTFPVTLIVADDNGDAVKVTTRVVVSQPPGRANRPPVADAGGQYAGGAGRMLTFDARRSSDPDQDALNYAWTFGDGECAAGSTVVHSYEKPGRYQVMLLVSDARGQSSSALTIATIADR